MEETKKSRSDKIFRVLYIGNLALMGYAILVAIFPAKRNEIISFLALTNCAYIIPSLIIFLGLNIWGVARSNNRRIKYIIIIVLICIWLILSYFVCSDFYKYIFNPLE